jgi:hypothetical protein
LSFLAGLVYFPDRSASRMGVFLVDPDYTEKGGRPNSFSPDDLDTRYRSEHFDGAPGAYLVATLGTDQCLRIIDPERGYWQAKGKVGQAFAARTNLSVIHPGPPRDVSPALGRTPPEGWCQAFEDVEMALQSGDIGTAAGAAAAAEQTGLAPDDVVEWAPLLEAHARVGDAEAVGRVLDRVGTNPPARPTLCRVWTWVHARGPIVDSVESVFASRLGSCEPPR